MDREEGYTGMNTARNVVVVSTYRRPSHTRLCLEANARAWTAELAPVTNGPFDGVYAIEVTTLAIPQGINLEAPSSP